MFARARTLAPSLLLFAGSLVLALAAAEFVLRHVIQPRAIITRQMLSGMGVADAEQVAEKSEDLGWIVQANTTFPHRYAGEFSQIIRTGPHGIRMPLSGEIPSVPRLLFVGDSVTAAYEVAYEETFVAKAASALNVEAVNAGVRGYSTEQTLRHMKGLLDRLPPTITDVVYVFSYNDPFENMTLHFPRRLMSKPAAYLNPQGQIEIIKPPVELGVQDREATFVGPTGTIESVPVIGRNDTLAEWIESRMPSGWLDRLYLYNRFRVVYEQYFSPDTMETVKQRFPYLAIDYHSEQGNSTYMPGTIDVDWSSDNNYPLRLLRALILEMKAEVERRGSRFWVLLPITVPEFYMPYFRRLSAETGIRMIEPDIPDRERRRMDCGGSFSFPHDAHFTPCAHAVQSESIVSTLHKFYE